MEGIVTIKKEENNDEININNDYRIKVIPASNIRPVSVKPDNNINTAITIMLSKNYSQLPVMIGERTVKGIITWKSIANKIDFNKSGKAIEYMERAEITYSDVSLYSVIETIKDYGYVLVKNKCEEIIGIVTSSDISEHFSKISEPFILLGKAEYYLRKIINKIITEKDIEEINRDNKNNRQISFSNDMTIGEYQYFLSKPAIWERLNIKIDRKIFIDQLELVRIIRNKIMHFDSELINIDKNEEIRSINRLIMEIIKEMKISI